MTSVDKFIRKVYKAYAVWELGGKSYSDWSVLYDKKDEAYQELIEKVPQITRIADRIWELIVGYSPAQATRMINARLAALKDGVPCVDCGKKIPFPARRCEECADEHEKLLQERRDIQKKINARKRAARLRRAA